MTLKVFTFNLGIKNDFKNSSLKLTFQTSTAPFILVQAVHAVQAFFFSCFPDLRRTECGLVQQPRCWVLPSLSSQEHAVVFLGLSSAAAQTVNARCQMRDCLHSSLSTGGNGVIGLKTWTLFESFVGIFIDFILIIYLLVYFSPVSWPLAVFRYAEASAPSHLLLWMLKRVHLCVYRVYTVCIL